MIVCSCYGCPNRAIGCHCFCPDYRHYRRELEEKKEFDKKKNERIQGIIKSGTFGK